MDKQIVYDAIVVGTGITGGWAAKELCEQGLKTLVLDRGRMVKHIADYKTMNDDSWDYPFRGELSRVEKEKYNRQNKSGWGPSENVKHFFANSLDHPYLETKPFAWVRGYHVGGRSLTWGRQSYRWSNIDFEANLKEGIAIDWPVRYEDIAPWYDKVESYIGVSGENLGLEQLPDGKFQPPMALNCVEGELKKAMTQKFTDNRLLTIGRVAHITENRTDFKGRGPCQYRNRCSRGCPFGGYFSSNSSTLPAAERTGNMTLRPNSIVYEVIYDDATKRATGVKVIDRETKEKIEFKGKLVFLCASAMASVGILKQSTSKRFPNGMGNDSGELGRYIMDHHLGLGASAKVDGHSDKYYKGRRPNGFYIPRFVNIGGITKKKEYRRGYGYQGGASRQNWSDSIAEMGYGKNLKEVILKPGSWQIGMSGFGEMLPYRENQVTLSKDKKDQWGLPLLDFQVEFKENEHRMREDIKKEAMAIFKAAGFKDVQPYDRSPEPGWAIHEMGGARMGRNPKTSVTNENNQIHNVPNVYVTDGAFMTSSSCVNPSLTYMAFTARAAEHAAQQFKMGKFD